MSRPLGADSADGAGWVTVAVPATSANLGPGFDSLGLALNLHDRISARFATGEEVRVVVTGEGRGEVATDGSNLVAQMIRVGLAAFDDSGELARRGVHVRCENAIPHGRGLGSSAAAIVGGLAVAALLSQRRIGGSSGARDGVSLPELVALGARLEGHPDNVAPAVLGGFTVAWMEQPHSSVASGQTSASGQTGALGRAARLDPHPGIVPVLMIPAASASTSRARGALPATVPHADAAFNVGRSALLVHALTVQPRLLLAATEDRLHQQHRSLVYPESLALVGALRAEGIPAAISGAGPTVIALAADLAGCSAVDRTRAVMSGLASASSRIEVLPIVADGVAAR